MVFDKIPIPKFMLKSSLVEDLFEHRLWMDMKFIGFDSNGLYEIEVNFALQTRHLMKCHYESFSSKEGCNISLMAK